MTERVKEIRNFLHNTPEPAKFERKTAAFLAEELKKAGYAVETGLGVGGNGVIGTLKGAAPGPVVAIKGDMDALTHVVDGQEVCVHSCGHDAHCAMILTMAEAVALAGIKRGTLKIVFQPAEEGLFGAKSFVEAGLHQDWDYLFGIHLRPIQEAKAGQATAALCHGSSYKVTVTIQGTTAHGARPHLGVNAIDVAAQVVNMVNTIWENPVSGWSVKTTKFVSNGVILNAIPDGVDLAFDLRAQDNTLMKSLVKKVSAIVTEVPLSVGAKGEVTRVWGGPAAEYDREAIALLEEAITGTLGAKGLIPPIITPGADDFHFYKEAKPALKAAFVGLGADLKPGLHDPKMTFNEDVLQGGAEILTKTVNKLLT